MHACKKAVSLSVVGRSSAQGQCPAAAHGKERADSCTRTQDLEDERKAQIL